MAIELSQDFLTENNIAPEIAEKVLEQVNTQVSSMEDEWKGLANKNAEKILDGAAMSVEQLTGIKREKGQKIADYIKTAGDTFFSSKTSALEAKEKELAEKLKNSGHNETIVKELETVKDQLGKLKEKEALFAEWEENDYKGKWEQANQELSSIRLETAFTSVKPQIPETVNQYEANYKWDKFRADVLEKYNIKIVEGEAIAVDKDNELITKKLSDLVKADKGLAELTKGKTTGFKVEGKQVKIEGVPFELPENANSKQRVEAIREYLAKQGVSRSSREYASKFEELNKKILSSKTV